MSARGLLTGGEEGFFVLIGRELWSITVDNGRTIRIIMGLGRVDGKFSSHINFFREHFPLLEFFEASAGICFGGTPPAWIFFIRFSLAQICFYDASPKLFQWSDMMEITWRWRNLFFSFSCAQFVENYLTSGRQRLLMLLYKTNRQ